MRSWNDLPVTVILALLALLAGACGSGSSNPLSGSNIVATVEDGYVEEEQAGWVADPRWSLVTDAGAEAELRASIEASGDGPDIPAVDYDRSLLLLARWDSCPHDRANVHFDGNRIWVAEEESNTLCEAPAWTISPVVLDWSTTGDTFALLGYDDPSSAIAVIDDRVVTPVTRALPATELRGRDGILDPHPDQPVVRLATTPAEVEALQADPLFPPTGGEVAFSADDPILLVTSDGCRPPVVVGIAGEEVRILRSHLDWDGCDEHTAVAVFVVDERFPMPLTAVGVDDFTTEPTIALDG